jgi:RNA polymerase sigma factor (sigma-70 family)
MDNDIINESFDNDDELVEQILSGMQTAVEKIYRKYYQRLLTKLMNYFINIEDAEDISQDTMIIVISSIKNRRYEHRGTLFSFIQGVSWRLYKKFVKGSIYHSPINENENVIDINYLSDDIEIEKEKRINFISQALKELDENCHDLLKYFFFDELKPRHIVNIMPELGTSEQVSKRKFKCLEKLRRRIQKMMKNEKK